ncbi:MAG: hypothetical protein NZL89_04525 [Leptospiraceae bacterium]|nr:hypothetical protein [Leptospiraceae bacterium]
MNGLCRFFLLFEYTNDDELIRAIALAEKRLPEHDYASRPFTQPASKEEHFKFIAFKKLRPVTQFSRFCRKVFKLQSFLRTVHLTPGYVSLNDAVTASFSHVPGAVFVGKDLWLKVQLVLSGKLLVSHSLSDQIFKDKRAIVYLNDVLQLVRGELR